MGLDADRLMWGRMRGIGQGTGGRSGKGRGRWKWGQIHSTQGSYFQSDSPHFLGKVNL